MRTGFAAPLRLSTPPPKRKRREKLFSVKTFFFGMLKKTSQHFCFPRPFIPITPYRPNVFSKQAFFFWYPDGNSPSFVFVFRRAVAFLKTLGASTLKGLYIRIWIVLRSVEDSTLGGLYTLNPRGALHYEDSSLGSGGFCLPSPVTTILGPTPFEDSTPETLGEALHYGGSTP